MALRIDRLREAREARGIIQKKLAALCGITEFQFSRYENGKNIPSSNVLALIAQHLNVTSDYLLGLSDDPHWDELPADRAALLKAYETGDSATIMELVSARLRALAETR